MLDRLFDCPLGYNFLGLYIVLVKFEFRFTFFVKCVHAYLFLNIYWAFWIFFMFFNLILSWEIVLLISNYRVLCGLPLILF